MSASRSFSYALEMVKVDRVAEGRSIMSMDHPLEHKPVFYFSADLKLFTNCGEITLPITMEAFVQECMEAKARGKIPDFSHEAINKMALLPKNESTDNAIALNRYDHGIEFANGGQNAKQAAPLFSRQWWTEKLRLG